MPSNRKFDRGKETKKEAAALTKQTEQEYERYMATEDGKKTEAMLNEYREKRGPSLMDLHQERASKAPRRATQETQFFDRERVRSSTSRVNVINITIYIFYLGLAFSSQNR
jgi:hypothetical protein